MSDEFTAELLQSSARGIASRAATELLDAKPRLVERFQPFAFSRWQDHLAHVVLELAASVRAGEPNLFSRYATWSRYGMEIRGVQPEDLRDALTTLHISITEALPPASRDVVAGYLEEAIRAFDLAASSPESHVDASTEAGALAIQFITCVLESDRRAAIRGVVDAVDAGLSLEDAYSEVLLVAQREIGRMWHAGEVSVAEEHFVTDTARTTMAVISQRDPASPPNGHTVIVASVEGNVHDIAVRALGDLFEHRGWRAVAIGADLPVEDVIGAISAFDADLLALSATLSTQVEATSRTIQRVRGLEQGSAVPVMVGGRVFDHAPGLWERIGADGYAPSVREAPAIGADLIAHKNGSAS
ncbi:MAG: cobalamin-dependent protein [Planctomycetota bacterium]